MVDFVETESRIANNPLYGRAFFGSDRRDTVNKVSCNTFNIQNLKCWFCEEAHFLEKCPKLRYQTYENRMKFIKEKKLCFVCLARNHVSKDCRRKRTCEICGLGHNTLTHRTEDRLENASMESRDAATTASSQNISVNTFNVECSATDQYGSVGRLNVIPVKVKVGQGQLVSTYAFFDSGSNSSFCSKSLCKKLGIVCNERNETKLSVSTINRT